MFVEGGVPGGGARGAAAGLMPLEREREAVNFELRSRTAPARADASSATATVTVRSVGPVDGVDVSARGVEAGSRASLRLLAAGHVVSVVAGVGILFAFKVADPPERRWEDVLWIVSAVLIFRAAALPLRRRPAPLAQTEGAEDALAPPVPRTAPDPLSFLAAVGVVLGSALLLTVTRPSLRTNAGVVESPRFRGAVRGLSSKPPEARCDLPRCRSPESRRTAARS